MNGNVTNVARTFALSIAFESALLGSLRYRRDLFFSFSAVTLKFPLIPPSSRSRNELGRLLLRLREHGFLTRFFRSRGCESSIFWKYLICGIYRNNYSPIIHSLQVKCAKSRRTTDFNLRKISFTFVINQFSSTFCYIRDLTNKLNAWLLLVRYERSSTPLFLLIVRSAREIGISLSRAFAALSRVCSHDRLLSA